MIEDAWGDFPEIEESSSTMVMVEGYGFIARRSAVMGPHDYGHLWSFAPHNKSGALKFKGAYNTRREARQALMEYKDKLTSNK